MSKPNPEIVESADAPNDAVGTKADLASAKRVLGIEAAAIGKARIATGTDLFLRAGALRWDAEFDHGSDEDGTDGFWGVGFSYGLDNLTFRGSVDRYSLDDADVEAYTLGLEYRFN